MVARLFVALVPPATVREEMAALTEADVGARWVPTENIHLTLRFIGETEPVKQDRYIEALSRVRVEPFILPVGGVGIFPTRGPAKVIWAGVGNGHTRLYQLRKQVDEALLSVDAGLAMPGFHPHFTVGRLAESYDAKTLSHYLDRHRAFEGPPFRVSEFALLASEHAAGRPPTYHVVRGFSLAG